MKAMAFNLDDFQKEIASIKKRGKEVLRTMEKMGADQNRINNEEAMIGREILQCRITWTQRFGDRLTEIIQEA
jgi:hypothetical protein